ncbi:MAG: glycosyltransferase [Candidatus Marinimicrobia bacterium]|nr:glycosyltransferase [Candidatus Neomarinimicrobiota bacterium]
MTLSIVIVSYNVREFVKQCLQSLRQTSFDGECEIILVDNNSHDGTMEMVPELFPEVRVISNNQNRGFAPALNQGLAAATGDYILSLNPDTIVEENTPQVLTDYLASHPQVGCVGPKILNSDGTFQKAAKRSFPRPWVAFTHFVGLAKLFPHSRLFARYDLSYLDPDETHEVEAISGACLCLTRTVLETVGPMDEDFFMWGDDLDYCYRVHLAGYKVVYLPETEIIHYKGVTHVAAPLYYQRLHFEAMATFARKHRGLSGGLLTRATLRLAIHILAAFTYVRSYLATFSSLIIDALGISVAFFLMIVARFLPDPRFDTVLAVQIYAPVVAVYVVLWLVIGGLLQIYSRYVLSYSRALISAVIGFLVIATLTFFVREVAYSRLVLVAASGLVALLIPGWRLIVHMRQATHKVGDSYRTQRTSIFSRRAVIMGAGAEGRRVAQMLLRRPDMGIDLIGFIDRQAPDDSGSASLPFLGFVTEIEELAARHRFQEVIVASEHYSNRDLMDILEDTRDLNLLFRIVPHEDEFMLGKTDVEHFGDLPLVDLEMTFYHRFHRLSKRSFDLLAAALANLLLLPLWPFILLVGGLRRVTIWTADGGQCRIWLLRRGHPAIRRLPLLWSIFKGNISFVGAEITPADGPDPHLLFKPGLTGLSQLRRVTSEPEVSTSYQHYYLRHQSLTFDIEIILKSLLRI